MKKRILSLALAPLFVLSLAACSSNPSTSAASTPAASTPAASTTAPAPVSTPISTPAPVSTPTPVATVDPISKANSTAGTYTVRGVVVGISEKAFLINDGTGIIMVYLNAAPSQKIGDYVEVSGTVAERYENYQFDNKATVKALTEEHDIAAISPVAYTVAQWDSYDGKIGAYISINVEVYQDGSFINFRVIPGEGESDAKRNGSFSYTPDSYGVDTTDAIGDEFAVEGFLVEVNSGKTRNTLFVTKAEKTKDNTVVSDSLVDATFSKDNLDGCTWEGQYSASHYANGSIKMNSLNSGVITPTFEGQTAVTVEINIASFYDNTKSREGDTAGWTAYGLDAEGNVVATGTHEIASISETTFKIELVSQTPITSVKVLMTNWFSDGTKCYNLGLGRVVVNAA